MKSVFRSLAKFGNDSRGTVAVLTAIVIFPLLFYCVGVPIDIARQVQLRSSLQNIADDAALAGSAILGEGGTAYQACTIANNYVQAASANGLAVGYSSLLPASDQFTTTAAFVAQGTATTNLGCTQNAPNTTTVANIEATTPNQVTVSISANLPTAFLAAIKSSLPVSVTATAIGPSNIVTICIQPNASGSIDYDALYFYGFIPATNTLETVGVTGTQPTVFTEPSNGASTTGTDPSLDAGSSEFLEDDAGRGPTYGLKNLAKSPCPTANPPFVAVAIHLPIATRIGFEMTNQTGGINPCPYAATVNQNGTNAGYGPVGTAAGSLAQSLQCVNNKTGSPYPVNTGSTALVNFYPTAYGGSVFTTNRFYSTDYPVDLNSSKTSTVSAGDTSIVPKVSGDATGDYSNTGQALAANTIDACLVQIPQCQYSASASPMLKPNNVYFNSRAAISNNGGLNAEYGVQLETADLVCLVKAGQVVQPTSVTQVNSSVNTGYSFSNIISPGGQQQNLVETNSATGNVLNCANTTDGSPYNTDPTCKQLNGSTLTAFWNDMGSPNADNVNYGDLPYSIQCAANSGIGLLDYENTALDQ